MNENVEKKINKMYKGQIANRILLIVLLILSIVNIVCLASISSKIKNFTETIQPAVETLSKLDVDEMNKTLTTINKTVDVFKINDVLDTLSAVDFDEFSDVISSIDVDKLNSTLDSINKATGFLREAGDNLKKFMSKFGIDWDR